MNVYAASSHFYLNQSQNQDNGENNESKFHVWVQRKIMYIENSIY